MLYKLTNLLTYLQSTAARLVMGTCRQEHITPVLRQLHWLPLRQRIRFKLAAWVCVPVTCRRSTAVPRRQLPSSVAH